MEIFGSGIILLCFLVTVCCASTNVSYVTTPPSEESCPIAGACKDGIFIPMWRPQGNLSTGDKAARATVYFAAMAFMFLGVSIIADRFMAAIEVITSKEREVTVKKPDGETYVVNVRIWNETVSNLTLMALGSSAPEILLSIIEICGNKFQAGNLGPSTIVGSAAFNLFIIIGICVYVIPKDDVRRIKHLNVLLVTATWSVFAYLWMYIIISVISYGKIEVWEGILTLMFFPATVVTAYIADRKLFNFKFLSKRYRAGKHKGVVIGGEGDMEMGEQNHVGSEVTFKGLDHEDAEVREFERHRKEFIEILRELRRKHPNVDLKTLEEKAEYEAMNRGPKSRAFYRIQATRKLTGGGNVIKKSKQEKKAGLDELTLEGLGGDDNVTRVYFEPGHYTVMENVGTFQLTVTRTGGSLENTLYVDYQTEDGTANAGSDFEYAEGTIVFHPGDSHKQFSVTIIDDDIFEEDEHFYVRLSNVRVAEPDGSIQANSAVAQLANPSMATVMILDDDHAGIFHFEQKETTVSESIGEAGIKVCRSSGARGCVSIPYRSIEGTAHGGGKDYDDAIGEIVLENDETEGYIKVCIIDDEEYEKNETFYIELGEPFLVKKDEEGAGKWQFPWSADDPREMKSNEEQKQLLDKTEEERIAELGKPRLGDITRISVHIRESMEFKSTVDKLLKKANLSLVVGTSSWREQFIDAITVSAGDDDEDDEEEELEEKLPSCMDYVMHFLTLFWKVAFAFVPPTDYWSGWACFTVSILLIGLLTGIIGDLASSFGCTIGLKDSVCAITFVALGTSLPDTFASKVAAIQDEYADSSVGNVTGSNAVNVFLGIGIAWTIASVYHTAKGDEFRVEPAGLAFSVTIFCVMALIAIAVLLVRRWVPSIQAELGGPTKYKIPTTLLFCGLWVAYIMLSALKDYCHISGF